jgi:hypothetical protein
VGADGADPDGAAVAVVAGVVDVLHIERVEHAAPGVVVVVAFDDVFAAVVEVAVAEQEAEAAEFQILLVVGLDGVGDDGEADLVDGAMPAGSGVVGAEFDGLVHFGVGEGLVLALVPAEAAGDAEILRDFLLGVVAEAVFERAEVLVEGDGGHGDAVLRGVRAVEEVLDGFAIGAHVRAVGVEEHARGAFALWHKLWRSSNSPFWPWARLKAQSMSMPLATVGMAKMP